MKQREKEQFSLLVDDEGKIIRTIRNKGNLKNRENVLMYIGLIGDVGLTVMLPIAVAGFIGNAIDRHVDSYPIYTRWFLIAGCFFSIVGFVHTIQDIIKRRT